MKLFIAGHSGMVGSALTRRFAREPGVELVLRDARELDMTNQAAVDAFYAATKPDAAIIAAAKVGGIHANNTYPAEFIQINLAIALNTIHGAYRAGVKRLLFLGSSCIYPKLAPQPIVEESLLTGPLEPTNEAYAIAKIAGLKLCQYYRRQHGVLFHSAMPTNLYGPPSPAARLDQHRHRHRRHHQGADRTRRRNGRLLRPHRVGLLQARRFAAQAHGWLQAGRPGLEGADRSARRHRENLRVVSGRKSRRHATQLARAFRLQFLPPVIRRHPTMGRTVGGFRE
jgi:nucleoside-diphosphate-sugar epimerase